MPVHGIDLVMFDIDGTLVDSDGFDGELYCRAVRHVLGVEVDRSWASYAEVTDSGILEELLAAHAGRAVDSARALVKRTFVDSVRDYLASEGTSVREVPGARQLIGELVAHPHVRVAVATGGWRESAIGKLYHIGIDPDGLAIATASDALARTRIMQIAEDRALQGDRVRRRTYFGDGPWDLRASRELGYDFVAVGARVDHAVSCADLSDTRRILDYLGL